jgi:maltooligosyltrehalose trehalohydrolase
MVFMGEEYGEPAPFQFFCDHIDPKIATATREGRRREFARFADFAGEDVPDPQDPATFERSKLSRDGDPALRELYAALLRLRRAIGPGEAHTVCDEDARWLRMRRNGHEIVCNFSPQPASVPVETGADVVLTTHDGTQLDGHSILLPALAGAVLR